MRLLDDATEAWSDKLALKRRHCDAQAIWWPIRRAAARHFGIEGFGIVSAAAGGSWSQASLFKRGIAASGHD
eukprot:4023543-Amphidinium_carterae.1